MNHKEIDFLGKKVKYYTPNKITESRVKTLFYKEPVTIDWIKNIKAEETVFDVGANVGMYSMLLASNGANVYAFEPEALNYSLLSKNIVLNNYTNIVSFCVGVLDKFDFTTLNSTNAVATGGSCYMVGEDLNFNLTPAKIKYRQGVTVITLDSFCEITKIYPNHIKIDVDGLDYKIINGNLKTLSKVKTAIVELNPNWKKHNIAIQNMKSLGFSLDEQQVTAATRKNNEFEGLAEHLFYK